MNDKERLEKFETAFKEVCEDYDKCGKELAHLKADNQMKTVKFRETLGRKLVLSSILLIFNKNGIKREDEEQK